MGKANQDNAAGGYYARKSAPSYAQRRALGAFVLIQDGDPDPVDQPPRDAARNAANLKAAQDFQGGYATVKDSRGKQRRITADGTVVSR